MTNSDLISRKEAISTIKSMLYQTALNSVEDDEKAAQLYGDIADNRVEIWLKLVDSVDAAPVVHGRWVYRDRHRKTCRQYTGYDNMGEKHTIIVIEETEGNEPYCSECGAQAAESFLVYCPRCGAKNKED